MPPGLTTHTNRKLYDDWNKRYGDAKDRIKELKKRRETATNPDDLAAIEGEIQELFIQANLIHQFLADVSVLVLIDENRAENKIS